MRINTLALIRPLGLLILTVLAALGLLACTGSPGDSFPTLDSTVSQLATIAPSSTPSGPPQSTNTPDLSTLTPLPTPTATPEAGTLRTLALPNGQEWQQVYVPNGSFLMGSEDVPGLPGPVHEVTLSGFWIDRMEVTNARYAGCVTTGECALPIASTTSGRENAFADPKFTDYPVVGVNWTNADAYCRWAGGRLPNEAEWEYAARGPESPTYPWGEEPVPCADSDYDALCDGLSVAAGSQPETASWVGALDMVGNVWEWVNDWYDGEYYNRSPRDNPPGPAMGRERVVRGSTGYEEVYASAAARYAIQPEESNELVGFRCVQ